MEGIKLVPDEWSYRGEGSANLVVYYTGQQQELVGFVLRLRKRTKGDVKHHEKPFTVEDLEQLHAYGKQVMSPFIGSQYFHPGELIDVTPAFIEAINAKIDLDPNRPQKRKSSEADPSITRALLLPDYSIFPRIPDPTTGQIINTPTICFEIKPKWGFLPSSPFLSPKTKHAKVKNCRYCMHQELKVRQGEWEQASAYCPLDLFSRAPERVEHALRALLEVPQNNLRVYRDAELIFGSGAPDTAGEQPLTLAQRRVLELAQMVTGAELATEANQSWDQAVSSGGLSTLCRLVAHILCREHVLDNVRRAQELDALDIEGVHALYTRLTHPSLGGPQLDLGHYAIQPCPPHLATITDVGGVAFRHRVAVIDLDPKPHARIPKYFELDQQIVEHCASNGGAVASCAAQRGL
eukprot:Colp12_sorted_trinity150504_noHs@11235